MDQRHDKKHRIPQGPVQSEQTVSASKVKVLMLWCLLNTLRLATSLGEMASVLHFFLKALRWRRTRSTGTVQDEILCVQGVKHVLGLGTGEIFHLLEIYRFQAYDRLEDFAPQPGWIVFDVGANSGVYTVQQTRRGTQVYAFEPNPDCYRRLQKSVRLNDLDNRVSAANYALGATAGVAELIVPELAMGLGSPRPRRTPDPEAIHVKVEVQTIDQVVRTLGISRIDLLKLDVEGFEIDVLQGAIETLPRVQRMVLEYHSPKLGRRTAELLTRRGLAIVLDQKQNWDPTSGSGMLFAKRLLRSASGRTATEAAMA
jgi:FkbM family methyltransferase